MEARRVDEAGRRRILIYALLMACIPAALVLHDRAIGKADTIATVALSAMLVVGVGVYFAGSYARARRRRSAAAELRSDGPVALRPSKILVLMVAAFLALIAIGSGVEIMDPAIGAFARNEPIVAALVTGLACPFSLWIAMRRLPPLTIDAAGITYPRAWQGTIPWRQIVAARIGPFAGQSSVILTVDPGSANPLLPGFRRITQRQSFADADRPILTGFLDVEAADLLERIEQERRRS